MSGGGRKSKKQQNKAAANKAAAKLLLTQKKNPVNQNAKTKTNPKRAEDNTQQIAALENGKVFQSPWVLFGIGTVLAFVATLVVYSHIVANFIAFLALGCYAQGLKFGIIGENQSKRIANTFCAIVWFIAIVFPITAEIIQQRTPRNIAASTAIPNIPPKPTIEDQLFYKSGVIQARKWEPPELPPNTPNPPIVQLTIGGMTETWPVYSEEMASTKPSPVIMPGGSRVVIPYVKNNRIYVKTETMFGDKEKTVQMNNEWLSDIPIGWDRNFNENSFEMIDDATNPVLQVKYDSPSRIEVYGVFVDENGSITVASKSGLSGVAPVGIKLEKSILKGEIKEIKPWFTYPSIIHLGELAQ
jgi:hypothetical protein